ncbi:succinate dehydrogenase, hydrophobic membrane anchor protein [Chitiniphilus eburneus]|uniref:Succinate dehydrogenase hydrophobic membrane anchor subunit n=1 Tax=Chitiniphilus eburneus TaxID=2571148 RepID=A0A4U0PJ43_9NEIS|nr:succinate dehydrogenase, hydrophobic membrane anchor protein [Chitiniphilus eburneus]TJZ67750.1 succinate dehydrogenase, hydrophobic membrane anchor protein [Chitiniphilus eburneus]
MVNRQVVGAHYGLRDWLVQRVTAVIMLVYAVGIVAFLLLASDAGYAAWQQLFSCTWVKVLTTVTVAALLWHAWVGLRDIWMDYVQPVGLRLTLHVLTILWLVASFIYSIHVVWGA